MPSRGASPVATVASMPISGTRVDLLNIGRIYLFRTCRLDRSAPSPDDVHRVAAMITWDARPSQERVSRRGARARPGAGGVNAQVPVTSTGTCTAPRRPSPLGQALVKGF